MLISGLRPSRLWSDESLDEPFASLSGSARSSSMGLSGPSELVIRGFAMMFTRGRDGQPMGRGTASHIAGRNRWESLGQSNFQEFLGCLAQDDVFRVGPYLKQVEHPVEPPTVTLRLERFSGCDDRCRTQDEDHAGAADSHLVRAWLRATIKAIGRCEQAPTWERRRRQGPRVVGFPKRFRMSFIPSSGSSCS